MLTFRLKEPRIETLLFSVCNLRLVDRLQMSFKPSLPIIYIAIRSSSPPVISASLSPTGHNFYEWCLHRRSRLPIYNAEPNFYTTQAMKVFAHRSSSTLTSLQQRGSHCMTSAVSGDNVWRLGQLRPPQLQLLIVYRHLRKCRTHPLTITNAVNCIKRTAKVATTS